MPDRLLLIEDEDLVRVVIAQWLGRAGYQVDQAASGEEALERLTQGEYDLLLVDLNLPGIDGMDCLREAALSDSHATALVISGYGSMDRVVESMHLGAQGFLSKPFTPHELLEAVKDTLERRVRAREAHRRDAYQPMMEMSHGMMEATEATELWDSYLENLLSATQADEAALYLLQRDKLVLLRSRGFLQAAPECSGDAIPRLEALLRQEGSSVATRAQVLSWPELDPILDGPPVTTGRICLSYQVMGGVNGLVLVGRRLGARAFSPSELDYLWITADRLGHLLGYLFDEYGGPGRR